MSSTSLAAGSRNRGNMKGQNDENGASAGSLNGVENASDIEMDSDQFEDYL